jgi:DNA-directed RNA polymerase specialized sigma24 family protein
MADDNHDMVSVWLAKMKQGDEIAVQEVWDHYFGRLVALARRTLANSPQGASDEEDVAQSAFKSFCLRAQAGRFPKLVDRDDLWKLLMTITLRKAFRNRRREAKRLSADPQALAAELASQTPHPAITAGVTEELRRLFGKLEDPVLTGIALMKLEGLTNRQIAKALDLSVATIERKLQVIRHLWADEI